MLPGTDVIPYSDVDLALVIPGSDVIGQLLMRFVLFLAQTTVREIEAVKKRHDSFENTLEIQQKKLSALQEIAENLIQKGHGAQN